MNNNINNPLKVIYCIKNKYQKHQYYHYIFLGNINNNIRTIIKKFKSLSLTDTVKNLNDKELNKLEEFYGKYWFKYFFNKEHIDFSLSNNNPNLNVILHKLGKNITEKHEYKPQFTYGFTKHKDIINSKMKLDKFLNYNNLVKLNNIEKKDDKDNIEEKKQLLGGDDNEGEFNIDMNMDDILNYAKNIEKEDKNIDENKNNIDNEDKSSLDEDEFSLNENKSSLDEDEFSLNENKSSLDEDEHETFVSSKSSLDEDEQSMLLNAVDNEEEDEEQNIIDENEEHLIKESRKDKEITLSDYKKTNNIIDFTEMKLDTKKEENNYDENLYNSFDKYYIYDNYINYDDTIKSIKNKICISIKNKDIFENNNLLPSRIHLWIRWIINEEKEKLKKKMNFDKFNNMRYLINSSNRKEEDICLGNLWIEINNLLHYPIKPYPSISVYENITKEIQELNNKLNKSTIRILRENLENKILSSYSDYLENNDIFMIDVYNEIGFNSNRTQEQIKNLQNTFFKLYFPDILSIEIPNILSYINSAYDKSKKYIESNNEIDKINNDYKKIFIESGLEYSIENIIHDIYINNKSKMNIIKNNYLTQIELTVKLISDDLLNFQRLELFKIFNNFILNDKYVFIKYTQFNGDSIFKFKEDKINEMIQKQDLYYNILKWFDNNKYGLLFKINYDNVHIPMNVFIDVMGKLIFKLHWKEEDKITINDIEDYYYIIKDLIKEINKIIENPLEIPNDNEFKILFITSIEKFSLTSNKEINHNQLSNFSRIFYPYFSLIIEPKKRNTNKSDNTVSKYGTYLRYKRVNDYENVNKIEDRIRYYIKYVDLNNNEIINEISKQFNLTLERTKYYFDDVMKKYPTLKKNLRYLKKVDQIGKYKMDGVDVSIQGKSIDVYTIRLSGVRNKEQMQNINDILSVLLFLYNEIYIKKTKDFNEFLNILNKIKNIAERRNFVSETVNYSNDNLKIKQIQQNDQIYTGYKTSKGVTSWSRLCQNSGKNNRRQPLQYTDDNIGELIKEGYKFNKVSGMYEKQTFFNGKKITLRAVKLKGDNESNIYYTCNPKNNGLHTYIGFLTKNKNPLGKYPPCCFKTDPFIAKNKNKQLFNKNQISNNKEKIENQELSNSELFYLLQDIIKLPPNRLGLLPDILDYYLNILNNKTYKINKYIISECNDYYFKYGVNNNNFIECICNVLDKTYDDIIAQLIISLNSNKNLFTVLNNGDIKFKFKTLDNYINYIKSNNYNAEDLIHLCSIPSVITNDGLNILILNKKYNPNEKFKWNVNIECINNEEGFNNNSKFIIINKYENNYYLLVRLNKTNKKNYNIEKIFNVDDKLINYIKPYLDNYLKINKFTAKDLFINLKSKILFQYLDIKNKCNYLIYNIKNKDNLIIPCNISGGLLNVKIIDNNEFDKYLLNINKTINIINEFNKIENKEYNIEIRFLIYDKIKNNKYRIRGIGINNNLILPIEKEYITEKQYKYDLKNKPSYDKLNKYIYDRIYNKDKKDLKDIKNNERLKLINANKYKNESYELFKFNLSYFFKLPENINYKNNIIQLINSNKEFENKIDELKEIFYSIVNNNISNKFYENQNKNKIKSNIKPFIYVYDKDLNIDEYELNNDRNISILKNKNQCNTLNQHEFFNVSNKKCMFSLSLNLLIEFINKLCYEIISNETKRKELLRIDGYKVSDIVDENYFINRNNQKILKRNHNDPNNPFENYFKVQNNFVNNNIKKIKTRKHKINIEEDENTKSYKMNNYIIQPVYEFNQYLRAISNSYYYYKNQYNLGYYNEIQDKLINQFIGDIIDYTIENNIKINIEDLINNSDLIDYKILLDVISKKYNINIEIINNYNKSIYSTGNNNKIIIMNYNNNISSVFSSIYQ